MGRPLDWDLLLALGREHRLLPLLHLRIGSDPRVPARVRESLREERHLAAVSRLAARHQLQELGRTLDDYGVSALALKGAALIEMVYPAPGLRPMVDIDLLVDPSSLDGAVCALCAAGYSTDAGMAPRMLDGRHWHYPRLIRSDRRFGVELHRRLSFGFEELAAGVMARGSKRAQGGLLFPDRCDLLIMVAIHFSGNRTLASAAALGQLADMAWTIDRCAVDWSALTDRVAGHAAGRYVFLALETLRLAGLARVPEMVLHTLRPRDYPDTLCPRLLAERVLVLQPWVSIRSYLPGRAGTPIRQLVAPGRSHMRTRYDLPRASLPRLYWERARTAASVYGPVLRHPARSVAAVRLSRQMARTIGLWQESQSGP
jgi:hypothetical protein